MPSKRSWTGPFASTPPRRTWEARCWHLNGRSGTATKGRSLGHHTGGGGAGRGGERTRARHHQPRVAPPVCIAPAARPPPQPVVLPRWHLTRVESKALGSARMAPRRLHQAPEDASGRPKLRSAASANQSLVCAAGRRLPARSGLFSPQASRRARCSGASTCATTCSTTP